MDKETKLVCTFNYNIEKGVFELSGVNIAENGYIIAGPDKNVIYKNVYESISHRKNSDEIFVDSQAINNGFYLEADIEIEDIIDSIKNITNNTFIVNLLYFSCKDLDENNECLKLKSYQASISKEETNLLKKEYLKTISGLIFEANLYRETKFNLNYGFLSKDNIIIINKSNMESNNVKDIINKIKKTVVAQDEAVEIIVPNVLLNQKLFTTNNEYLIKSQKNNILLEGPTGVGKTLIVEELAKIIKIPIVVKNITNYSGVGYIGEDLKSVLTDLLENANGSIEKAEKGIICFDEIDKLGDTKLEIRKGIAQELLSWMNGTIINIKYKDKRINFNTSNITFVGLGAFESMRESKKNETHMGFEKINKDSFKDFSAEDYVKLGGMPRELMGRFNNLVSLKALKEEELKEILLYSSLSPLKNFIELASIYNVEVTYDESFLIETVRLASKDNLGARSLQREINKIRNKYLISIMSNEIESIELTSSSYYEEKESKKTLSL